MIGIESAPIMIALMFVLGADDGLPATVGSWSLIGVMAGILGWFLRRWSKQRDDAFKASQETEERVSARYEKVMTRERDERRAVEAVLIADQARMRIALSRVVSALDSDMTRESRNRLRTEVLGVLFEDGSSSGGNSAPSEAPQG